MYIFIYIYKYIFCQCHVKHDFKQSQLIRGLLQMRGYPNSWMVFVRKNPAIRINKMDDFQLLVYFLAINEMGVPLYQLGVSIN